MTRLGAAEAAERVEAAVEAGLAAATVVVVDPARPELTGRRLLLVRDPAGHEQPVGSIHPDLDAPALEAARAALAVPDRTDGLSTLVGEAPVEVFVEVRRPVRELVIVGAGHIARPLCSVGALLGFRVTVLDDRPDFATRERFPEAERVLRADFDEPFRDVPLHGGSHVLLVTRGHKYDYACLVRALAAETRPAYIGMIGSRRRVRATWAQLLADGIPRDALEGIHAPVGLDVGAETPEEIAVAVAAELVLVRRGGSGRPLRDVEDVARRFFAERPNDVAAEGP